MFTAEDRDRVRGRVLALAEADERVVAGALVGSLAHGAGDQWSDLDLTFAVADELPLTSVLDDWTETLGAEFDALHLFDLEARAALYRVLLLPDGLQVDLSCSPASRFGAASPRFELLFGQTVELPTSPVRPADDIFGWGVAWARDARACIERQRLWEAEHCVNAVREHALMLACRRRGLPISFGRGYDALPADVLAAFDGARVVSLEREALLGALTAAVEGLLRESAEVGDLAANAEPSIREWLRP